MLGRYIIIAALLCWSCSPDGRGVSQKASDLADHPIEICDNQKDDDKDSQIDCRDSDCRYNPICAAFACVDEFIDSKQGSTAFSGATKGVSLLQSSCGGASAPEKALYWVAPEDGIYTFDTFGSDFDTLITLFDAQCGGAELTCNDDTMRAGAPQSWSLVKAELRAKQSIIVVLDGRASSAGNVVLNINAAPSGSGSDGNNEGTTPSAEKCDDGIDNDGDSTIDCHDDDCKFDATCLASTCPSATLQGVGVPLAEGFISEGVQTLQGSCGGAGNEKTFLWTAPHDGVFTFGTAGSLFATTLYLRDGTCNGAELKCGKAMQGDQPVLAVLLRADQQIIVVVDSDENAVGRFAVNIWDEGPAEICNDSIDNDLDGVSDCSDADCALENHCLASTCPNGDLGSALASTVTSGTWSSDSLQEGTCGGSNGPEHSYLWTAPAAGTYAFDLKTFSADAVVYLLDSTCDGQELACNAPASSKASAHATLEAGQQVIVVVDSDLFFGSNASFQLGIRTSEADKCADGTDNDGDTQTDCDDDDCRSNAVCIPSCPEKDLGSALGTALFTGTTVHYPQGIEGSCGGYGAERTLVWTAPASGYYTFDTVDSTLDTVLYVREGTCMGRELGCNNDISFLTSASSLTLQVTQDQQIVLVVDSNWQEGEFTINIQRSEMGTCADTIDNDEDGTLDCNDRDCLSDAACCVTTELPPTYEGTVASGDIAGWQSTTRGSCGGSGNEHLFVWTAPVGGKFQIDSEGTSFDSVLYVRNATCSGSEIACDDDSGVSNASKVIVRLQKDQTIVIALDSYGSLVAGTYQLQINALEIASEAALCHDELDNDHDGLADCADADCAIQPDCQVVACDFNRDLDSQMGMSVVSGSTVNAVDQHVGSCGGDASAEQVFVWQAPATSEYVFDTLGSAFDTVVYLLDASCKQNGFPCDDNDEATLQSRVFAKLVAGQTVLVVVDGYNGSSGDYVLNIHAQASMSEVCDDLIDNDGDDQTDCADPDCGTASNCPVQGCVDHHLGSLVGFAVAVGSTVDGEDRFHSICGGAEAPEVSYGWIAPQTGTYIFDTRGSNFDTVLYVQNATCGEHALVCDDNEDLSAQSLVTYSLQAGDNIGIVIDGANGASGIYILNIAKR
jgi:hypothetical protein